MSSSNFWGALIVKLREEQKISQRQLAADARVNRSTLRRIEENATSGDIDVIERLLDYLGYELEALSKEALQDQMKMMEEVQMDPAYRSKMAAYRLLNNLNMR